jgi:hypothetical protein
VFFYSLNSLRFAQKHVDFVRINCTQMNFSQLKLGASTASSASCSQSVHICLNYEHDALDALF